MSHAASSTNGGLGGIVDIRHLNTGNVREHALFGSWPQRNRKRAVSSSAAFEQTKSTKSDLGLSAGDTSSEGWITPQTPRTPMQLKSCFTQDSPIVLSPDSIRSEGTGMITPIPTSPKASLLTSSPRTLPAFQYQKREFAAELPGSLLLPSQGYPQTTPPVPPLRPSNPSRSSSADSGSSSQSTYGISTPSRTIERQKNSKLRPKVMTDTSAHRNLPPPPPRTVVSPNVSCSSFLAQIPLSRMSLEELIEILPYLDAAIIANDWIPCVKKRHVEVKATLQSLSENNLNVKKEVAELAEQLLQILDTLNDLSTEYEKLFHQAHKINDDDSRRHLEDLDTTRSALRSALGAVAQQRAQSEENRLHSALEFEELRSTMRQIVNLLGDFIYQHLPLASTNGEDTTTNEVLQIIANNSGQETIKTADVPTHLYKETKSALQECEARLTDYRCLLSEQNNTIRQQSEENEAHVRRFEKLVDSLKIKERETMLQTCENGRLRSRLQKCEEMLQSHQTSQTLRNEEMKFSNDSDLSLQRIEQEIDEQLLSRDAEIANLRSKLTDSALREQKLQRQIRSMIQEPQSDPPFRSLHHRRRLKRLLPGDRDQREASKNKESATELAVAAASAELMRVTKDSPEISGKQPMKCDYSASSSPLLSFGCDPNLTTSRPSLHHRRSSSIDIPSRLRVELFKSDKAEIEAAVNDRFAQLPSHVKRDDNMKPIPNIRIRRATREFDNLDDSVAEMDLQNAFNDILDGHQQEIPKRSPPGTPQSPSFARLPGYQRALSGIEEVSEDASQLSISDTHATIHSQYSESNYDSEKHEVSNEQIY